MVCWCSFQDSQDDGPRPLVAAYPVILSTTAWNTLLFIGGALFSERQKRVIWSGVVFKNLISWFFVFFLLVVFVVPQNVWSYSIKKGLFSKVHLVVSVVLAVSSWKTNNPRLNNLLPAHQSSVQTRNQHLVIGFLRLCWGGHSVYQKKFKHQRPRKW